MGDTNFQSIFDYIDQVKDEIKGEMATKADIEKVLSAVLSIGKNNKDLDNKIVIQESKTEQMEHWIIKAAEKTQVPYNS